MLKTFLKNSIKKNTPRWIVLLIDLHIVVNTMLLAYLVQHNFNFNFDKSSFLISIPLVMACSLISFLIVGSYKGVIRHTGFRDSVAVLLASFCILIFLGVFEAINSKYTIIENFTISYSILVVHFLLNVFVLISSRLLYKEFYNLIVSDLRYDKKILIYGAGDAGNLTYSVFKKDVDKKVQIIGFADDDAQKARKRINGLPVFNAKFLSEDFILNKKIDEIIIAINNIKPTRLIEIVDKLALLPLKVKIVPPLKSWVEGDLKAQQIKQVKIEDLLGRDSIELDNPILKKEFRNKKIVITGAAGSIGSEITRQLSNLKIQELILIDQSESELYNLQQYFRNKGVKNVVAVVADVRNRKRMDMLFKKHTPDMVFHAAAYKHVPFMEENPYEAVCVNVAGTKNVADLAIKYKVGKFVMVSTDKAVNPTNIMGATKRIAEMYITTLYKNRNTKFITTRFGNVLGSNGSVIPLFKSQIECGGPLTVTDKEITRYFMTIPEACQLVLEAGTMGNGGEIYVFDMGESIKIFDLAKNMISLSGLRYPEDIDIKITGLRPGEKIYEELLATGENTTPTYHKKIMIAKVRELDAEKIQHQIKNLCKLNKELNVSKTVYEMKEIVPEFISNNSIFGAFDFKTIKEVSRVS